MSIEINAPWFPLQKNKKTKMYRSGGELMNKKIFLINIFILILTLTITNSDSYGAKQEEQKRFSNQPFDMNLKTWPRYYQDN
jgi:hypothetical protein